MHLSKAEQRFLCFLYLKKDSWVFFNQQKIYKTHFAFSKMVKKFLKAKIIKIENRFINGKCGNFRVFITLNNLDNLILNDVGEFFDRLQKND